MHPFKASKLSITLPRQSKIIFKYKYKFKSDVAVYTVTNNSK
jgi:hypothetical protein